MTTVGSGAAPSAFSTFDVSTTASETSVATAATGLTDMESNIWVVIGLAISTAVFFTTTALLCVILTVVICRQKMKEREHEKTKDVVFEGKLIDFQKHK